MKQDVKTGSKEESFALRLGIQLLCRLLHTRCLEPTVIQMGLLRQHRDSGCLISAALPWLCGKDQSKKWVIQRVRGSCFKRGLPIPHRNEVFPYFSFPIPNYLLCSS